MNNLFIGTLCILILYIYSSYGKIIDVIGTAELLHRKTNLHMNICILGIIIVIILELFGSLFVLYSIYTNTNKKYTYYTIWVFIIFNIVVTLIYHNPFEQKQFTNFLKNLSITGGFILLLDNVLAQSV